MLFLVDEFLIKFRSIPLSDHFSQIKKKRPINNVKLHYLAAFI